VHALRVIEFEAVLGQLQGHCQTEVGVALAEALSPAFDESTVWARLTQTTEADALVSVEPVSLAGVADVRSAVSAAEKGASLDGETLYQVAASLQADRVSKVRLAGPRASG
jgi:dsDNA-specific endonuclease/ATPase MutS2